MMYCKSSTVGGFLFLIAFACWINAKSSEAFGTFGFDIHHRYSDTVKDFLDVDGLPAKGSLDYNAAMAHRDQLFKARRLATSPPPLPFSLSSMATTLSVSALSDFLPLNEDDLTKLNQYAKSDNLRQLRCKGLTANSFSMCFGPDGGRIEFGDKGTPDQAPSYNVTVTQISMESNVTDLKFTAIFDSGTSFTYLNDPAYTVIVQGFGTGRFGSSSMVVVSAYADFVVNIPEERWKPTFHYWTNNCNSSGGYAYCLAVVKSADINIIGQNFMIGYRMVFDREEMVLGWTASDCYDSVSSNNGSNTLPVNKGSPAGAPPPSVLEPEATPNRTRSAAVPSLPPPSPPSSTRPLFGNDAARINSMANSLLMVILSIFLHQLFLLSS
ncbi:UNVERIFIED_CONTAM: Aspartyl protease family protein 1 [Sesamum calycinum]|uniref:Aspartyl protease family protein 1 n=1 Tax=Sesamum calycinum TaxID=2727403 RepID=A0AAW2R8A5_9LAMI